MSVGAVKNHLYSASQLEEVLSPDAKVKAERAYQDKLNALRRMPHSKYKLVTLTVASILATLVGIFLLLDGLGAYGIHFQSIHSSILSGIASFVMSVIFAGAVLAGRLENKNQEKRNLDFNQTHLSDAQKAKNEMLLNLADKELPYLLGEKEVFLVHLNYDGREYLSAEISGLRPHVDFLARDFDHVQLRNLNDLWLAVSLGPLQPVSKEILSQRKRAACSFNAKVYTSKNAWAEKTFALLKACESPSAYRIFNPFNDTLEFLKNFEELLNLVRKEKNKELETFLENSLSCVAIDEKTLEPLFAFAVRQNLLRLQERCFYHILGVTTQERAWELSENESLYKLMPPSRVHMSRFFSSANENILSVINRIDFSFVTHLICDVPIKMAFFQKISPKLINLQAITIKAPTLLEMSNPQDLQSLIKTCATLPKLQILEVSGFISKIVASHQVEMANFYRSTSSSEVIFVKMDADRSELHQQFQLDSAS